MSKLYALTIKCLLGDLRQAREAGRRMVDYDERSARELAYNNLVMNLDHVQDTILRASLSDIEIEPLPAPDTLVRKSVLSVPATQTEMV